MKKRKIDAMHAQYGELADKRCKDCCHLISGEYHDKRYHKCELYGISHSEATDWRLKYTACGAFNVPDDKVDYWNPLLQAIVHERNAEPPLEGQIDIIELVGDVREQQNAAMV